MTEPKVSARLCFSTEFRGKRPSMLRLCQFLALLKIFYAPRIARRPDHDRHACHRRGLDPRGSKGKRPLTTTSRLRRSSISLPRQIFTTEPRPGARLLHRNRENFRKPVFSARRIDILRAQNRPRPVFCSARPPQRRYFANPSVENK